MRKGCIVVRRNVEDEEWENADYRADHRFSAA